MTTAQAQQGRERLRVAQASAQTAERERDEARALARTLESELFGTRRALGILDGESVATRDVARNVATRWEQAERELLRLRQQAITIGGMLRSVGTENVSLAEGVRLLAIRVTDAEQRVEAAERKRDEADRQLAVAHDLLARFHAAIDPDGDHKSLLAETEAYLLDCRGATCQRLAALDAQAAEAEARVPTWAAVIEACAAVADADTTSPYLQAHWWGYGSPAIDAACRATATRIAAAIRALVRKPETPRGEK